MKDVLSQEEIDALLEQVVSSDAGTPEAGPLTPGVRSYDLSGQQHIVRGRLSGLESINQRLSSRLRGVISPLVRQDVDIEALPVTQRKFGDYVDTLYLPSSLNLVSLAPLRGTAMIVLDARLVFRIVDFFFGGSGRHAKVEGREFTPTEINIVEKILHHLYRDLEEVWRGVLALQCQPLGSEYNPAMATIVPANENVVVSTFQVQIAGAGGEIHIVMPEAMLEPVRQTMEAGIARGAEGGGAWRDSLEQHLGRVMVRATCRVAELELNLSELAELSVGDFLPFNLRRGSELTVGSIPIHRVQAGSHGSQWAVKVMKNEIVDSGAEDG